MIPLQKWHVSSIFLRQLIPDIDSKRWSRVLLNTHIYSIYANTLIKNVKILYKSAAKMYLFKITGNKFKPEQL